MRIISGKYKGRPLKSTAGVQTRPTTDKVKETMFNVVGPYFSEGVGLDLFAGSGGLGIEALSRGLDKVIFIDKDYAAIQTLKSNLKTCNIAQNHYEVYRNDAERALKVMAKRNLQFDIIFLDPPYHRHVLNNLLEIIHHHNMLTMNGIIICEHDARVLLPNQIGQLIQQKTSDFGSIGLTYYYRTEEDKEI
ncbi:16S rRNA (guanine(966)-N(2))-methyltransferase RsmD [Pseudogracilibacillus auburnensis]|uniref:16S rRNA (guanine(966)-N(2))-methyltransferase RsmD n=1 Tax=Pseudogracilibacillus auburnensis TaxID=1494959 RepID=UPI001A95FF4A|nr:16S rRNA (guanine(966)-N(2))-methyltransferase RsmD [Pseudogracilibacillus auburnensis]MBO1004914.1 16S rRNA (guanine(966)-N(2))-methyltransferase RsmD [Pseudogracilibacillus auburnensis]